MEIIMLAGVGGAVYFMYANYLRNKKKIVACLRRVEAIEKHLGLTPPPAPPEE